MDSRYASSGIEVPISINPVSDTPTSNSVSAEVLEGAQFLDLSSQLNIVSTDSDGSEALFLFVEDNSNIKRFIDVTNQTDIGLVVEDFDFGNGKVTDAVKLSQTEFANLGLVFDGNYQARNGQELSVDIRAAALDAGLTDATENYAFAAAETLTIEVQPVVDPVTVTVDMADIGSGFEDQDLVIPVSIQQQDSSENLVLYLGNFTSSAGTEIEVNKTSGFRPNIEGLADIPGGST